MFVTAILLPMVGMLGAGMLGAGKGRALQAELSAAEPPVLTIEEIGFAGFFKAGHWAPVRLKVAAPKGRDLVGQLIVSTLDGDAVETHYGRHAAPDTSASPVRTIPAGQAWNFTCYFRAGRHRSDLTASWRDAEGRLLAATSLPLREIVPAAHEMIVTIGGDAGVDDALRLRNRSDQSRSSHTIITSAQQLPDRWYGYESVDWLVLTTASDWWETLTAEQAVALRRWLVLGGQMLLSVGERGAEVADDDSPLAELLPGSFGGTLYQGTPGLEHFTSATERLESLTLAVLDNPTGAVLAYDRTSGADRLPLIVRAPRAFGRVTYVGVDLDQDPMNRWGSRAELLALLIRGEQEASEESRRRTSGQLAHQGFQDIAGQLRSAMDRFPADDGAAVATIGFSVVAGLVLLYIVLIGPADYFFLKKIVRRMEWTWVTFPIVVLGFSLGIWMLGRYLKGDQLRLNQIDIVDLDLVSGEVRGTMWSQIYTPESRRFNLSVRVDSSDVGPLVGAARPSTLLAWAGLPGTGMGGMETAVNAATFLPDYHIETDRDEQEPSGYGSTISRLPLPVASTKGLVGRWSRQRSLDSLAQTSQLMSEDGILHGTLTNVLDTPLQECTVMFQNWSYRIDSVVQPGEAVAIESLRRRDLEWRLTRRRLLQAETSYATTPWDATSTNVPRILEMMMFHGAAGGTTYTGLSHRYYDFIDISSHLEMGRAVLVGRAESPATELLNSGEPMRQPPDRHWTYYRVVYPVSSAP